MLEGNWYRTGDLGYVDENGYLFIYDRLKDIIKYNGYVLVLDDSLPHHKLNKNDRFQVSPQELEEILVSHPLVDEAAVCGVWSEAHASDLVRAYVVPGKKQSLQVQGNVREAAKTISEYVSERVSSYKRLNGGILFVNELPKNATGKVLRRVLKENAEGPRKTILPKI